METSSPQEIYFSVDVETAGPCPSQYSLLSIGACRVDAPRCTFYIELKPVNQKMTPAAAAVHHLDLKRLSERGTDPENALKQFESWVRNETPDGARPIFVAFNAAFDWMFVNDYFHRYIGYNPFGHSALDIKAFYMGLMGVSWEETALNQLLSRYLHRQEVTHHALRDALDQAEMFKIMLEEARRRADKTAPLS